jgi:prepilin-type N-terminal cleavage/methylation domain-containing protein
MLAKLKKRNQGFTIIEVMIVLAIAGLILLIVFLAVPALQRSSRNTQRKQDVGRITSAATTVLSDNNNTIADLTNAALQAELGTLSFYANTSVTEHRLQRVVTMELLKTPWVIPQFLL